MKKLLHLFGLTKKEFIILLVIASILKCILLYWLLEVVATPARVMGYLPDSKMYETIARNIISGNGYSSDTQAPFTPNMLKEPLYPIFIALIYLLSGESYVNIIIAQILLNPAIAIMVYLIGREIFEEEKARIASLLVCLIPNYGEISFFILAETFYIPVMLLFIYVMLVTFKKNKLPFYFLSGILLGLAALCRVIIFYAYGLVMLLIALGYSQNLQFLKQEPFKRRFSKGIIFTFSFLLVVLPWIVRNGKLFGSYQISTKGGLTVWVRSTIAETFTREDFKAYLLYMFSGRLAQKKYPDFIGNDLGNFEYRFVSKAPIGELAVKGYSEGQIDSILAKEGTRKSLQHPFKLLAFSAIGYIQVFKCFIPWSIWFYEPVNRMAREIVFPGLRFIFGFPLGMLCVITAILGAYYARKEIARYALIILLLIYYHFMLFFITASPGGVQRFILPITPLYFLFVSISISQINKKSRLKQEHLR